MQILALPLISIIFKNKLGSFGTDCRCSTFDKMTKNAFIIILLTISLYACKTDKKEIKSDMKKNLTEKNGYKLISFDSKSIDENGIITDLIFILEKINKEKLINKNQLLFYIDATNGNIFISGYHHETQEVFDNNGIGIEFYEYWNIADNAVEFDETIINSIKKSFNSDIGKKIKENFQVYFQTEIDDAERI